MLGRRRGMKRGRSVRAYVVRLVFAVALPLLAFGAFLLIRSADNEQHAIATTVHERAQGAAADLDRELRNLQDLVSILAATHHLFVGDSAASHPSTSLLKGSALGLVVRNLSGELLLNTCTADGRIFPASKALDDVVQTIDHGKSYISDLMAEPISGDPLLTIDLRVWRDENSAFVLSLCTLPRILQILIDQHLPNGWTAVVIDSQGRTIASIREAAGGSFAAAGGDRAEVPPADDDPIFDAWGNSSPGYSASSPVYLAGWTVLVNVPSEIFFGPVRRALLVLFVAGGGTLALVLVLAVNIGRRRSTTSVSKPRSPTTSRNGVDASI
jgi:hypothetical protein